MVPATRGRNTEREKGSKRSRMDAWPGAASDQSRAVLAWQQPEPDGMSTWFECERIGLERLAQRR